ncbi:MAG TPA: EAL domain-containing protein [Acidimicrobiia bacterium]|nr:EAL domain-containing protein [Acidimicrobiia bacterium]
MSISKATSARQPKRDLEAELKKEIELRQAKDDFLAAASHYITTPLSAVLGYAELLGDRSRDFNAGVRNQFIELLAIQARETTHIVDDLLIAARFDLGGTVVADDEVDLRDAVEAATHDWASNQRSKLSVSGNAVAKGDGKWVIQIVRNLLRNAESLGGENIWVRIRDGFNKVILEVADDGEGMAVTDQEKIFEAYSSRRSVDDVTPPLGLALSVAHRLARAMGGDLRFYQEAGENVFELSLAKVVDRSDYDLDLPDVIIDPLAGRPTKDAIAGLLAARGPEIVYQPIVDMRGGGEVRTAGYESLARFPSATPSEWFEVAGGVGLRLELELAAIRNAIIGFAPSKEDEFLGMNISDATLVSSSLATALDGIDPGRVVLELSEETLITSYEETRRAVDALRERGIRLAVDDVGSGDIDLWHILSLEPAFIKIDMTLVRGIGQTPRNRALIRGLSTMAQDLGVLVVAVGIETGEERDRLLELGVQFGQGYLFGRPRALQWKTKVLSGE